MNHRNVLFLGICILALCMIIVTMVNHTDAYLGGYLGLTSTTTTDLDTSVTSYYPQIGLYGGLYGSLYGGLYGGLYGLYGLGYMPSLNYLGYLYGVYGTNVTDVGNIVTNPAGLAPNIWSGYGITYHPLFGYYQPYNLFETMFALTNLFSWW